MIKSAFISGNRGAALIITLLIISALTALILAFREESHRELNLAQYTRDGFKAREIARSAVELALAVLENDEEMGFDSLTEEWAEFGSQSFPEGLPAEASFAGGIIDEQGKFNLNTLLNENGEIDKERVVQMERLFKALDLDEDLIPAVLDWLDDDDEERMGGAENYYYQGLDEPYACSNGRFLTPEQIYLVKGFKDKAYLDQKGERRLLDYLTIYGDGKINLNTAPSEVLQSLHDNMDDHLAESIIEYREEKDFENINALSNVPGLKDIYSETDGLLTVNSLYFSIDITINWQDAVVQILAVVERGEKDKVDLIYYRVL
jgi:general secretion pathway protein K